MHYAEVCASAFSNLKRNGMKWDALLSPHSSVNCYVSKAFLDTRTFTNVPFILNVTAFIYIIYM